MTPCPKCHGDGFVLDGSTAILCGCVDARKRIDGLILKLWLEYRNLSDIGTELVTDQDMDVWGAVTLHDAIQLRLNTPPGEDYEKFLEYIGKFTGESEVMPHMVHGKTKLVGEP
jgi:hypothetical protein